MYAMFKDIALRAMKAPTEPPEPPTGAGGEVRVFRASPRFLTYRLLGFWLFFSTLWLIDWGFVLAGFSAGNDLQLRLGFLMMPFLAIAQLCLYFEIRIGYDMRYYIVTDHSLRVREGAFIVKEKTISYANVQNIGVLQGPLQRFFGISNLKVDTAGGGSSEKGQGGSNTHHVQMAGIENAGEVRDLIRGFLTARGRGAGLGDLDDRRGDGMPATIESAAFLEVLRDLKRATAALRAAAGNRG